MCRLTSPKWQATITASSFALCVTLKPLVTHKRTNEFIARTNVWLPVVRAHTCKELVRATLIAQTNVWLPPTGNKCQPIDLRTPLTPRQVPFRCESKRRFIIVIIMFVFFCPLSDLGMLLKLYNP